MRASFLTTVTVALAGLLLGAGLAAAQGNQALLQKEEAIQKLLVAKLGADAEGIRVTVTSKKVVLTGMVTDRSTQELAKEVALSVDGVKKVDVQVTASTDRSLGKGQVKDEADDSKVESAVKAALAGEIGKYAGKVEVEVAAGWVSLRGPVPDESRRELALKAAQGVSGVTKVVDLLRVKP